jgi:hypothetical protein
MPAAADLEENFIAMPFVSSAGTAFPYSRRVQVAERFAISVRDGECAMASRARYTR